MSYVQSLWGRSPTSAPALHEAARSSGGSAQQLGNGVWPLSAQVREEIKKGTRYNMKVILRGTKGSGKSTLLARLTGHPLPLFYTPSTEITASTMRIQGEQCAANEGTKVDIWEVVEEGRQHSAPLSSSLHTTAETARHTPSVQLQEALRVAADARLHDVYAGAHLTIFLVDPRQRASWEYAKQEAQHVPPTCCVLYALNFADVAASSPSSAAVAVSLAEVQAWCGRSRRATTAVVHHILEGRQAAEEFSVRPMTAVLSAFTGSGIMGVVRALHVASTLLRITAEEVRVMRLFELMARQQAFVISDDAASQPARLPLPTSPPAHGPAELGVTGGETQRTVATDNQQLSATASASHRGDYATLGMQQTEQKSTAATAAAVNPGSSVLRMEHRATPSSATAVAAGSSRPLSEAETMRLFLGSGSSSDGGGSNASGRSSRSSSSCSSPVDVAKSGVGKDHGARDTHPRLSTRLAGESRVATLPTSSAAEVLSSPERHSKSLPPSLPHTTPAAREQVPVGADEVLKARLPEEELARVVAATMVHDTKALADDFFLDEDHNNSVDKSGNNNDNGAEEERKSVESSRATAPASPPPAEEVPRSNQSRSTPSETAEEEGGGMRARPLWTQRVVRRTSAAAATASVDGTAPSSLHADVSLIVAEMTAALAARVPPEMTDADAPRSEATTVGQAGPDVSDAHKTGGMDEEKQRKKKSSMHHRHSKDSASGRHEHTRHRKHREHNGVAEDQPESQTKKAQDDGSFELVVT